MEKFKELGLSDETLAAISKKGFEEPTEIQALTIPLLLNNESDIIAQAQTGTGKTAAFGLPLIERLDPYEKNVQAIILAPTRELVIQVCEEINSLKGKSEISIAPIYGGQSIELQLRKLKRGVTIVVGTPGRLLDHIKRKTLQLGSVKYFILDEADEMLNMGFVDDIEKIFEKTPAEKRVLLFSATMPNMIKKLAERYMGKYSHIKTKTDLTTNLTDQIYFEVSLRDKFESLCRIIDIETKFYGLVFCRTKNDVDDIAAQLFDRGYSAEGLHGDIAQSQREKILNKFKKGNISILVATDVAARGIDVNNLSHVINYSIPQNPEAYVHRIGRTGRAGNQGTAITFITPSEFKKLVFIKRAAKTEIRRENVPEIKDIINIKKLKISEDIENLINDKKHNDSFKWAKELLEKRSPEDLLAAVLQYSFGKIMDIENYQKMTPLKTQKRGRTLVEEEGQTRLFISKGRSDKITKKGLVELIIKQAGTRNNLIEDVEIYDNFSFITVPFTEAEIILKKFRNFASGKRSIVSKAKDPKKPDRKSKQRRRRY